MSRRLYTRLAWTGIKSNKQLYYPYFVAAAAMVVVFYIFDFLSMSEVVGRLPGKEILPVMFQTGTWTVGLFSIPFLFYTNSTLVKKRKKELGLYNILGMNKKNIFSLLFCETIISYGIVVISGLLVGILLSKIAELGLIYIMNQAVSYRIYIEWKAVLHTILVFAGIFFLILLNMLRQVRQSNPIELLRSDSVGERPPRGNGILACISLVLILASYLLAFSLKYVEETFFFKKCLAVGGMLIVGTFFLFICASVFLCRQLQKRKNYYYQTAHFVTVSTMTYRMKRNGASLAVICILMTLILVAFSCSISFYVSSMDIIRDHYPHNVGVTVEIPEESMGTEKAVREYSKRYEKNLRQVTPDKDTTLVELYSANMLAMLTDDRLDLQTDMRHTWFEPESGYYPGWEQGDQKIVMLRILSLKDYNQLCGTEEQLDGDEVLLASDTVHGLKNKIVKENGEMSSVKKELEEIPQISSSRLGGDRLDAHGCETMYMIVPDLYEFFEGSGGTKPYLEKNYMEYVWEYGIHMPKGDARENTVYREVKGVLKELSRTDENANVYYYSQAAKGERYYAFAGGLLFLAVMVNILFLFVTALIMYYKQISEGYEDQRRFSIMRKIGMTTKEMKKSIYSQMFTVFLLPFLVAGIHLIFTSNIVYLLLKLAVFDDKPLLLKMMGISYLIFAVVYTAIYLLTSKTYFKIVNQPYKE